MFRVCQSRKLKNEKKYVYVYTHITLTKMEHDPIIVKYPSLTFTIVKDAASIFDLEDLACSAGGPYDDFMTFLMEESEQRYVLSHYFVTLFAKDAKRAREKLSLFLFDIIDDSTRQELLEECVEDIKNLLKGVEDVEKIFAAYDKVKEAIDNGAKGDALTEIVKEATEGVAGMEDWKSMF